MRKLEKYKESVADYACALALLPNEAASDDDSAEADRYGPSSGAVNAVDLVRVRALTNKAYGLARLGRFQEAIADYSAILAVDPHNGHAYHNRGIMYDKLGQQDLAIQDFGMVLQIDSKIDKHAGGELGVGYGSGAGIGGAAGGGGKGPGPKIMSTQNFLGSLKTAVI